MKRCPQCEFVYEDEQTLCDMDGSRLAFDSRPLPKLQALTGAPEISSRKSSWRSRLITALASIVLGTVLALVYYVSTHRETGQLTYRPAASNTRVAPANSTVSLIAVPVSEVDSDSGRKVKPESKEKSRPEAKTEEAPKPRTVREPKHASSENKNRPTNPNASKPQPVKPVVASEEKSKKDSKVGAVLKKTGNLLKKPFKL